MPREYWLSVWDWILFFLLQHLENTEKSCQFEGWKKDLDSLLDAKKLPILPKVSNYPSTFTISLSLRIYSCIFDMNFLKIHFHFPGHFDPHVLLLGIFTLQFLSIAFFQIFTWIIFSVVSTSAISVASRLTTRKIRFPLASRLSRFFTSKSSPWKCENLNFWRQKSWIFLSFQNQFKIKTFEFSR